MGKNKLLTKCIALGLIFGTTMSYSNVRARESVKRVARPLVLLVDFQNYKHSEIRKKEKFEEFKFNDHSKEHYDNILFNGDTYVGPNGKDLITMKGYYKEQSKGTYDLDGDIYGWYTLDKNIEYYGEQKVRDDGQLEYDVNVEELVKEAADRFVKEGNIDLAKYDIEDRNDLDNDGNIHEADGLVDHLIVVHAGIGQALGGGSVHDNAIWAHRGKLSKDYEVMAKDGSKIKFNDYTIQAQDSAPGTFCHEYAHDLGVDDEYDTSNTGGDNPVGAWSIMSEGCYTGEIFETEPVGFSPFCKKYFKEHIGGDWIDSYEKDFFEIPKEGLEFTIGSASIKGNHKDALQINLPNKKTKINEPTSGMWQYYSGNGDSLNNSITTEVNLLKISNATLKFNAWYDIEDRWDFASVQVREVGKNTWDTVKGNITTEERERDSEFKGDYGITGKSNGWVKGEFNLDKFTGKKVEIKIEYLTDIANLQESKGIYIDDIVMEYNGEPIFKDDVEEELKFQLNGFTKDRGILESENYYMLEWRTHDGVDRGLKYTPDGISYDPGLVVWYVDHLYKNNWVKNRPAQGFIGVVDVDQNPITKRFLDSNKFRTYAQGKYQLHDAALSLKNGSEIKKQDKDFNSVVVDDEIAPITEFNDCMDYSNKYVPGSGVKLPEHGLKIEVLEEAIDNSHVKIRVSRTSEDNIDTEAPEVIDIRAENNKIERGHNTKVIVDAVDNLSTLGDTARIVYTNNTNEGLIEKTVDLVLSNGRYEGIFETTSQDNIGVYHVNSIVIKDALGNENRIYNLNAQTSALKEVKDFSEDKINVTLDKGQRLAIENLTERSEIKLGGLVNLKLRVTNGILEKQKFVVVGCLYDQNGKLVYMKNVEEGSGLAFNESKEITLQGIDIPKEEKYELKVYLWDSLENMNALRDPLEIHINK